MNAERSRRPLQLPLGVLLAALALPACAGYRCLDPWGHVYVSDQDLAQAGMQCDPLDADAAVTADAVAPASPTPLSAVTPLPRRGMLVLAPPAWLRPATATNSAMARTMYDPLIAAVASAYGQDSALLRAIVQVESRFDPSAVSARGAIGLMQIMPATATQFGLAEPQRALFEPEANLRTGAQVLRSLLVQFAGDPELAVAAYNAGPGAVMRSGYAVPAYPETQNYVRSVLAVYRASR